MAARRNRPKPVVAVGEILMWLLFTVLLVPAGAVGWAIGHYTGHHGGTRTVTVSTSAAPATATTATTATATAAAPATTTAAATTAAAAGNAAAGKAVFISTGCGACHTFKAAGTSGTVGPNLDGAPAADAKTAGMPLSAFVEQSIVKPDAFIAKGYPKGVMPGTFGQSLSKTQLADLVAFITGGK